MNIGTWNVQGIKGKIEEISKEMDNLKLDIMVLTETKKKGSGTEIIGNYTHIFSGVDKHERAKRGVSILIHRKLHKNITDFETINENMIKANLNVNQTLITILGIYALSEDEPYATKDEFFENINEEITKIGNTRELLILGDLNSRTGQKMNNKVVGPYGELIRNDNGERLIEICESHNLKITNGFFKHKEIHRYTWTQPTRNLKSIIDYLIVKQQTRLQINDVRAYRGVTCGSDHHLVKAKIRFQCRNQKKQNEDNDSTEQSETLRARLYNLESLMHESTKKQYQCRLDQKLSNIGYHDAVHKIYKNIVESIHNAAKETLGLRKQTRNKNLWWNEEIESLVKRKKEAYQRWLNTKEIPDRDRFLEIKRTARRTITTAKREMWDRKCQEINTYLGGRKSSETWKFINKVKTSEKNTANIQLIPIGKWKTYYEELLTEDRDEYTARSPTEIFIEGETISIESETLRKAVMQLKNGRAAGPEEISAELIKCGTEKLFKLLTICINKFLNGAPVPAEWKVAYISSIHKKGNKADCSNYRGISVTSTLSRLYGRILRDLIEEEYREQEEEEQSGFRAGRSCNDNLFVLKHIVEKRSAHNLETHLMFIDLHKAYDTVPVNKLWIALQETNISHTLIKALKDLYNESSSQVKVGNKLSEKFIVNKGLRQGCCVSPTLFKIYVAKALSQWKRKCRGMGIDLGETCLYTLQFADDQVIIANEKDDLQYMARKLQEEYKIWGLELNTRKTKYLPIGADLTNIQLDDEEIEACSEYTYLGSIFDTTGKDDKEITKRVVQARKMIGCLNGILWSDEIGKKRKNIIYESLIKSSLLYGAETWRISENNKRKVEAVEMDAFRRILGISRRDRVRNEEIRHQMGIDDTLSIDIERKQLIWYGHVQRMADTRLPKKVLQWVPANRKKRGRPRKTWKEGVVRAMSSRDLREDQWNDRATWRLGIGQRRKTF